MTSDIFTFESNFIPFSVFLYLFFKFNNSSCIVSNSSKANLFRASPKSFNSFGKCILCIAFFSFINLYSSSIYSGNVSAILSFACFSPSSIMCLKVFCDKLYVNGYIGIILPVFLLFPSKSYTGDTISVCPILLFILPKNLYVSPILNIFFKYDWLYHTSSQESVSSLTINL